MDRRDFVVGLGASMVATPILDLIIPHDHRQKLLVGSLGTWADAIARGISEQWQRIHVVSATELIDGDRSGRLIAPRVVLVGALGGQSGLRTASAYAEIGRKAKAKLEAIVLMPGYWEGRRRMETADTTLRILSQGRVQTKLVNPEVAGHQTVETWGETRRQALELGLLRALGQYPV